MDSARCIFSFQIRRTRRQIRRRSVFHLIGVRALEMKLLKLAIIFALIAPLWALAENEYSQCEGGSKQAIAICAAAEREAADVELNGAYQEALQASGKGSPLKSQLVSVQRQWLKFATASCSIEKSFTIGDDDYWSAAASSHCFARLSQERARTLRYYACVFTEGPGSIGLSCHEP